MEKETQTRQAQETNQSFTMMVFKMVLYNMFYSKKHTPGVTHQSPRSDSHRHRRTNLRTHAGTNRRPHNPRVTRNHRLHAGAPQLGEHLQEILQAWIKHLRSCDGLRGRRDAGCHGTSFRPVVWVPRIWAQLEVNSDPRSRS